METTNYYDLLEALVNDFGKNSKLTPNNIWKGDLKLNYDLVREDTEKEVKFTGTMNITDSESNIIGGTHSMSRTFNRLELSEEFIKEGGEATKGRLAYQVTYQIFLNGLKNGQV